MRVLGTTKSGTRIIMLSEQIAISMVGLLLGTGVLRILKGTQLLEILQQVVVFTVLYIVIVALAAAVSAVLATRKNVLELLQTKE